ncbi:MAG: recombinase family protein [Jatrophihabitans sp.]|nr:MAG: recombinase family protein [Jatrophihabitans sp.]
MKRPRSAAIYARISKDITGEQLGVQRQLQDCRELAREMDWTIGAEYTDNDRSAFNGKIRPQYRLLLEDLRSGLRDGLIIWHADRLHRSPVELEEFIDLCEDRAFAVATVRSGALDLTTASGRTIARIHGAIARGESERMGERMRRSNRQAAEQGRPATRGPRSYGYTRDGMTIVEAEAAVVRVLAERFLAGESIAALTRWLNDSEIPTATGGTVWWSASVRQLLRSARVSGQREYHGEIVAPGTWPTIITPEQTTRIRRTLDAPERKTLRTPSRYLLTGLLRCGRCDRPLISHPKHGVPGYDCRRDVGKGACGKLSIVAEPLDEYVRDLVLTALDGPELAAAMLRRSQPGTDADALAGKILADEDKLTGLAEDYAAGEITREQFKTATAILQKQITANRERLATLDGHGELARYLGQGEQLRDRWHASLSLDQRRAVIRSIVEAVTIHPATVGTSRFDPDRAEIRWRV